MPDTLTYSSESEDFMMNAYQHQNNNLQDQLSSYAAMLIRRRQYRWVNGRIVFPLPYRESEFFRILAEGMNDAVGALTHLERGVGEWCAGCRYNYSGHQIGLSRGATLLGLR